MSIKAKNCCRQLTESIPAAVITELGVILFLSNHAVELVEDSLFRRSSAEADDDYEYT